MKKSILIITFLIFHFTNGQSFEENIPKSYKKVTETKGDLDKDGIDEIVYVYNTDKETKDLGFERELYICKIINGRKELWKKNKTILWNSKEGSFFSDNIISIKIQKNTLILEQIFSSNTKHSITYKNIFRYQNNDWYLIGSKCIDETICVFKQVYEINFSINNVFISDENFNCYDLENFNTKKVQKTFKSNFKEIPRMDDFKAGQTKYKIPNTNKYVYY